MVESILYCHDLFSDYLYYYYFLDVDNFHIVSLKTFTVTNAMIYIIMLSCILVLTIIIVCPWTRVHSLTMELDIVPEYRKLKMINNKQQMALFFVTHSNVPMWEKRHVLKINKYHKWQNYYVTGEIIYFLVAPLKV